MTVASGATDEKYLVIKGRAGLGNRILAALTGILYARAAGRRVVVDWRDESYSDDGSNAFPHLFDCPSTGPTSELPSTGSIVPEFWRGRLDRSVIELRQTSTMPRNEFIRSTSLDLSRLDYGHDIAVVWLFDERINLVRRHLARSERHRPKAAILRDLLRDHLRVRPAVRERADAFRLDRFEAQMIGVHVRYSDRRVELESIVRRLDQLIDERPGCGLFLATDNLEVKERFEQRYHDVATTPHWYPPPGTNMHQSRECPDRLENGVEALVDLCLLASCDHLVCDTRSSFARVAALLSSGTVVDVRPSRALRRVQETAARAAPGLASAYERAGVLLDRRPRLRTRIRMRP